MSRIYDRIIGDSVTLVILGTIAGYNIHWWWIGDAEPIWAIIWSIAAILSANASKRLAHANLFEEADGGAPPLRVRFLGHPVIAWPIIAAASIFGMLATLGLYQQDKLLQPEMLLALVMVLPPLVVFARWNDQRRQWRRGLPKRAAPVPKTKGPYVDVPVATVLAPPAIVALSIPDAMNRLQPELLQLVRQGLGAVQQERQARH